MEKKTILAVVLSILIIIGYQFYAAKYCLAPVSGNVERGVVVNEALTEAPSEDLFEKNDILCEPEISTAQGKVVTIEAGKYVVTLNSIGGCVTNMRLNGFNLIDIPNPKAGIFNMEGFDTGKINQVNFRCEERSNEVVFTANMAGNVEVVKKYVFHDSPDLIELDLYIKNNSDKQINTDYLINTASYIGIDSEIDKRYIQGVAEINGKIKKSGGSKNPIVGSVGYAGLQNRYFSVIVKNSAPAGAVVIKKVDHENVLTAIRVSKFAVLPHSMVSHKFLLYAGPTDKKVMGQYDLAGAADGGLLGGISDVLVAGLRLFHKIFRNWGVAVILLSVLVNLILFPLSRKSYESMKKMQHVQPHMDKLRQEHKDNPHKLNKEMMELYKKHDVNPMGGCLPLLLQMPVFIALYQALMKSLELRGSGFLWVKDLSMPDAVAIPFTLPLIGNSINVLPVLMTIAMVFQQKFSTVKGAAHSPEQKQQQQMMLLMPVIFLFVMYNFPSGLVLYWFVNTLLTMFEQRAIMHG